MFFQSFGLLNCAYFSWIFRLTDHHRCRQESAV